MRIVLALVFVSYYIRLVLFTLLSLTSSVVQIRPYHISEKEAVVALLRLNTPKYFDVSEEAELRAYLDNELEDYFVVCEGETLVAAGGINYFLADKSARIAWDVVDPAYQGRGVGRLLTAHRIERLQQHEQVNTVIVRTAQLVHGFYERMGFSLARVVKDYWAAGYDLYEMELQLNEW